MRLRVYNTEGKIFAKLSMYVEAPPADAQNKSTRS